LKLQEIEFERDVFLGEIARLTLLVKKLKQLCNHASTLEDRDQIGPLTSKAKSLEDEHKQLEDENAVCAFAKTYTFPSFFPLLI
jgi:hypothetical protein